MSANHKYEVCVSPQEWEFSQGPKTTTNPNGEGFNFISTLQYPFQTRDEHFISYMFIFGVGIWWLNVYYKKMFIYSYDFFCFNAVCSQFTLCLLVRRPFENLLASIYPASCHRKVLRSMRTMPPKMVDMIAMATYPIPRELTRESLTEIFCLITMDVFLGGTRIVSMIFSILSVRLPACALCLLQSHFSPSGNQYLIYYWDMTSFHKELNACMLLIIKKCPYDRGGGELYM